MNQPRPPKDERIVAANTSPDAAIIGPSSGIIDQPGSSDTGAANNTGYPLNAFPSIENYYYGGFDSSTSGWNGYPQYASADGLQIVPPVIYGDNTALGLHPLYGFNSQMTYGQYSPVSTPVPPVVVDNQLFSPQQIPYPPSYYPQAGATSMPNISASVPVSQDLMNLKGNHSMDSGSNASYYNLHGMFGSSDLLPITSNPADLSQRTVSPITSAGAYSQPIGTFASYDPNIAQTSQQRPMSGYGLPTDFFTGQYAYDAANQNSNFYLSGPQPTFNYTNQIYLEKGRNSRHQVPNSVVPCDRNRGPRALKVKGKSSPDNNAVSVSNEDGGGASSAFKIEFINRPDFPSDPENAKFFIIKSFSEDNVHRSIKYGVWSSTVHGNKKLDDAYKEAKESGSCPVYLFFSVNASSQFCGVAEMVGPVDFEKNADYWQQDRWSGQFPVTWHMLKDVPNSKFHHILLENNDNKPVTHSRDSQEVKLEQGTDMLKIFKEFESTTSILDDFDFYDERERMLQERKNRQVAKPDTDGAGLINVGIVNETSDKLDRTLQLEDNTK